jgi:hypothetical protein
MQYRFFTINDKRMPCIMPALKAHNTLGAISQPIDNFALTLITPLGTDHHYISSHNPTAFSLAATDNTVATLKN